MLHFVVPQPELVLRLGKLACINSLAGKLDAHYSRKSSGTQSCKDTSRKVDRILRKAERLKTYLKLEARPLLLGRV